MPPLHPMDERVIAEVDLEAIRHNVLAIKSRLQRGVKYMSVLKADAYGHGAVKVAQYIGDIVDHIAVATIDEGIELRKNGITKPVLVLGETIPDRLFDAKKYNITTTIFSKEILAGYSDFVRRNSLSISSHVAVDTGMNRIGIRHDDYDTILKAFSNPYINIEGIFSHLAQAEDEVFTAKQVNAFNKSIDFLNKKSIKVPMRHIANSIGSKSIFNQFDCVRAGIEQYYPESTSLLPAMTLKARIVQVKDVPAGESIGYDRSFTAKRNMRVATVAIGYADGLMRSLSNVGKMLVGGKIVDIVGKVCMDFSMIDVSETDRVLPGDYAEIFGQGILRAEKIAEIAKTIPYEVLTNLSERVVRVYKP